MAFHAGRLRLGLFVALGTITLVNGLALYGEDAARWVAAGLQAVVGSSLLMCAVLTAFRSHGVSRWWRFLVVAATACWLPGEMFWWLAGADSGEVPAPPAGVAAYFLPPVLALVAMGLISRSGGSRPFRHADVVAVLDGLVAAAAFSILVLLAGLGATTGAALPRSPNATVVIAYSFVELSVVVTAVFITMSYPRDSPHRANLLFLAGGVALIAASDRMIAYLQTIGIDDGNIWGGIGLVLGPLLIAFAVTEMQSRPTGRRSDDVMDWVQSVLPYIGFLGIVLLCGFHVLIGKVLPTAVVVIGVIMVVLVSARQVMAMRAQRLLTERLYEAQRLLAHQVHHDPLTGLPNRLLFAQRLNDALRERNFVLLFVDIDDFKDVNDQYGHAAGDELLCAIGNRLRTCVGAWDTLARIGGDEFAILIAGESDAPDVVADRLRVALRDPFGVHGSSVRVRASMGLVRPPSGEPAPTPDDLMRQADISMYAGKRLGKDTTVIYHPSAGVVVDFPTALRQANGGVPTGFTMAYQPVVSLPGATPVAMEALARWTAPNGMQIPPATFVAVAEGAGLGAALDAMVLDLVCREVREAGLTLDIHVNIGAARLGNRAFEEQVALTLERHGVDAGRVILEITETVPIVDLVEGAAAIARLRAIGVKVALDDFGAGYNSLTYLHALPVQVVKLDRGLAVNAQPDRGLALHRSVIGLCDALGLDVIAEGIEYAAQAEMVLAAGCRLAQGHLYGRATTIDEVIRR